MGIRTNTGRSPYDQIAGLATRLQDAALDLQDIADDLPQILANGDEQRLQTAIAHLHYNALRLSLQSAGVSAAFARDVKLVELVSRRAEGRWSDRWNDYEPQGGCDIPCISDHGASPTKMPVGPLALWAPTGRLAPLMRSPEENEQSDREMTEWTRPPEDWEQENVRLAA